MAQCPHPCSQQGECAGCSGCSGCSGPREIALTREEAALLGQFALVPFLPYCVDGGVPLFSSPAGDLRRAGEVARGLAKRGLLDLDSGLPLQGCDYGEFSLSPQAERGSAALTALGRAVLDALPE